MSRFSALIALRIRYYYSKLKALVHSNRLFLIILFFPYFCYFIIPLFLPVEKPLTYTFEVIACVSTRRDAANIREWIAWNHLAGIQHFVIFDNNDYDPNSVNHDEIYEALAPFIQSGLVTLYPAYYEFVVNSTLVEEYGVGGKYGKSWYDAFDKDTGENFVKQKCYDMYRNKSKWIAFFDTDEYFTPVVANFTLLDLVNLPEFNSRHHGKFVGGIGVHWRIFSWSGHYFRPDDGSVKNYKPCDKSVFVNRHIKTIARTSYCNGIGNAHYLKYNDDSICLREDSNEACNVLDGNIVYVPQYKYFQLNHYYSRSWEDYLYKMLRGSFHTKSVALFHGRDEGHFIGHICESSSAEDDASNLMVSRVSMLLKKWVLKQFPFKRYPPREWMLNIKTAAMATYLAVYNRMSFNFEYYKFANLNRTDGVCLPSGVWPEYTDYFINFLNRGYKSNCLYRY